MAYSLKSVFILEKITEFSVGLTDILIAFFTAKSVIRH